MQWDIQGGAEKVTVTVKNKINQKWLVDIYKNADGKFKPRFTDNQVESIWFSDLDLAIKTINSLSDYGLSEWAFYRDQKLIKENK